MYQFDNRRRNELADTIDPGPASLDTARPYLLKSCYQQLGFKCTNLLNTGFPVSISIYL